MRRIAKKMSTCRSNTCSIHHCPFLATGYQITGEMVQVSVVPWERTRAVHQLPRVNCLYLNSFWLVSEILVFQMNWSAGEWPVFLKLAQKGLGGITRIQRSLWNIEKGNIGENCFVLHGKAVSQQSAGYVIAGKTSLFQRRGVSSYSSYLQALTEPTPRSKDAVYVGKEILTEGKVSAAVE